MLDDNRKIITDKMLLGADKWEQLCYKTTPPGDDFILMCTV
jgi:hypothetical protein